MYQYIKYRRRFIARAGNRSGPSCPRHELEPFEFEQVNMGEMPDPVLVLESLSNVQDVEKTTSGAKVLHLSTGSRQRHKRKFHSHPIQESVVVRIWDVQRQSWYTILTKDT